MEAASSGATLSILWLTVLSASAASRQMLDQLAGRLRFAHRSAANECTYNHEHDMLTQSKFDLPAGFDPPASFGRARRWGWTDIDGRFPLLSCSLLRCLFTKNSCFRSFPLYQVNTSDQHS